VQAIDLSYLQLGQEGGMDYALFLVVILGLGCFIWLYQKASPNQKWVSTYVTVVLCIFVLGTLIDFGVARREKARFSRMSNADHLSSARQAVSSEKWKLAKKHLDEIVNPDPDMQRASDALRSKVTVGLNEDEPVPENGGTDEPVSERSGASGNRQFWDSLSFISHTKTMTVSKAGGWMAGAYRLCATDDDHPSILYCDANDQTELRMDVVFDGSMDNKYWDCKHREIDILCVPKNPDSKH
jgi:hypothetical protein